MTSIALVPGLLVFIAGCFAACPDPPADSSLDINKLAGHWWGYKIPAEFKDVYKCGDMDLKPRDEDILDWKISEYDIPNSNWKYMKGAVHKVGEGKYEGFRVGFSGIPGVVNRNLKTVTRLMISTNFVPNDIPAATAQKTQAVKWSVLGTDYNNWMVYWQCHETNERQWAFLMSRAKSLSPDAVEAADKALPAGSYIITEQADCPSSRRNSTYSYF